ncbi:MAG: hypothetical protein EBR82_40250 [Caulobacteraceae bacterium]|nr:hypothetical protein [Caulobacteraceae bacterium]
MPATNYTPIQLYRTNTASTTQPSGANLNFGELAINYNDGGMILYAKNTSGTVIKLMNNPANLKYPTADGTAGQIIQTDGAGTLSFTSAASLATPLAVIGNATAGAEIRLPEDTDNGSSYVAWKAPNSLAANVTWTMPTADGTAGQTWTTNGSGTLSFGTLGVAGGGTGITSGTSGGIPYYSATTTIASSALLAANALMVGGGAGVAPSTVTTGSNVLTALAVNVGTAGAFVVNGGALGTPSSGTLTSCTGLPVSGVSGLGTNVATALAVAVGSAGAVVVNGGALGTPSSGTLTSCTGLPISTGVSGLGTGVGAALGNTADAASGVATTTGTATLTNKRITQRCNAQTTTASPFAWNSDSYDQQSFSALANALTINADAGTPTDGQRTTFRIKDNGTARALTWTTGSSKAFRAIGVTLPTTTVINKTVYVGCIYNAADDRWDAVAVAQEA